MALVYDRSSALVTDEPQFGHAVLRFLYHTSIGRVVLTVCIQPWVSEMTGWIHALPLTRRRVVHYIEHHQIDPADYVDASWHSFADFFRRQRIAIPIDTKANALISCAEAALMTYAITKDATLHVKYRAYRLVDIIGDTIDATQFEGGTALVYRLAMHNYHRYIYPDSGRVMSQKKLPGVLHTISSTSRDYPVYSVNQRHISVLETQYSGVVAIVEVGAMIAGKIVNDGPEAFHRGDEKGRFEIGGSTIIVLYTKGSIRLDEDIRVHNTKGIEVAVTIGESIGELCLND